MNKFLTLIIAAVLLFSACDRKEDDKVYPEIKVGTDQESLKEISINKFTERKIILSGGNKKYQVNVENSRLVKASVYRDTLKIKAMLEGSTFASIKSHNQETILKISVVPRQISTSLDTIRLMPKDISKFVSVNGGGDIVHMEEIDPDNILEAKWNGQTGILEIKAHYEGEAKIIFKSQNVISKEVNVIIRSQGETKDIGIYSTTSKDIYVDLKPVMIVKRKNVGTWLSAGTNPYGTNLGGLWGKEISTKFSSIKNPQKGTYINVHVTFAPQGVQGVSNIHSGINKMYIEDINNENNTVVLRGRGYKVVLPIEE